jgi:hypothetical protein
MRDSNMISNTRLQILQFRDSVDTVNL